jgi:hypothetical protein
MAGVTARFPNVVMRRPIDDGVSAADGGVGLPGVYADRKFSHM